MKNAIFILSLFVTYNCFAQKLTDMETPLIRNQNEIIESDGKKAKIYGIYTQMNVAKKQGVTKYVGRAMLVLEDGHSIAIEKDDKGYRTKEEIAAFEGKNVVVTGTLLKFTQLWGSPHMASIVSPAVIDITELVLNPQPDTIYKYADGNGNVYKIGENTIYYLPVTKARSSSGNYSGGEPKSVTISPAEKEKLVQLLEKAFSSKEEHQTNREMMTGAVSKSSENEQHNIILKPNSIVKSEIETYLKTLLK